MATSLLQRDVNRCLQDDELLTHEGDEVADFLSRFRYKLENRGKMGV